SGSSFSSHINYLESQTQRSQWNLLFLISLSILDHRPYRERFPECPENFQMLPTRIAHSYDRSTLFCKHA
ncbi:MAG TPA: hypothetical protein VI114_11845, partial [Chthoniobacterales bacterium]